MAEGRRSSLRSSVKSGYAGGDESSQISELAGRAESRGSTLISSVGSSQYYGGDEDSQASGYERKQKYKQLQIRLLKHSIIFNDERYRNLVRELEYEEESLRERYRQFSIELDDALMILCDNDASRFRRYKDLCDKFMVSYNVIERMYELSYCDEEERLELLKIVEVLLNFYCDARYQAEHSNVRYNHVRCNFINIHLNSMERQANTNQVTVEECLNRVLELKDHFQLMKSEGFWEGVEQINISYSQRLDELESAVEQIKLRIRNPSLRALGPSGLR